MLKEDMVYKKKMLKVTNTSILRTEEWLKERDPAKERMYHGTI